MPSEHDERKWTLRSGRPAHALPSVIAGAELAEVFSRVEVVPKARALAAEQRADREQRLREQADRARDNALVLVVGAQRIADEWVARGTAAEQRVRELEEGMEAAVSARNAGDYREGYAAGHATVLQRVAELERVLAEVEEDRTDQANACAQEYQRAESAEQRVRGLEDVLKNERKGMEDQRAARASERAQAGVDWRREHSLRVAAERQRDEHARGAGYLEGCIEKAHAHAESAEALLAQAREALKDIEAAAHSGSTEYIRLRSAAVLAEITTASKETT